MYVRMLNIFYAGKQSIQIVTIRLIFLNSVTYYIHTSTLPQGIGYCIIYLPLGWVQSLEQQVVKIPTRPHLCPGGGVGLDIDRPRGMAIKIQSLEQSN